MSGVVIHANVFKGYYEKIVGGRPSSLTACPSQLFEKLGTELVVYVDQGEHIKQEWQDLVDRQWFTEWYTSMLLSGHILFINRLIKTEIRTNLIKHGFPKNSKDWVYIWVACAVITREGFCTLVTEDLDFYDPSKKRCAAKLRRKILLASSGNVAKYLRKHEIRITCCSRALNT